ncbi:MAG TPA: membrane-associated protein [Thermoanaerobaculia bacterium]|nr:membrane-associated protein [Thermoanaerobaculia bacterium]
MPAAIPAPVKVAYTLWLLMWIPVYWIHNGPWNFLWFCDLANLVLAVALWRGSSLLLSSQAVGVLLVQVVWCLDLVVRLLFGVHPLGATRYMWEGPEPLFVRLFSLFHLVVPVLLLWGLSRLGYDRRGLTLQTAISTLVLPICFLFADPELNLNWLWRPFEQPQVWLPPWLYLLFCLAAYPLLLFWPTHWLLGRIFRPPALEPPP